MQIFNQGHVGGNFVSLHSLVGVCDQLEVNPQNAKLTKELHMAIVNHLGQVVPAQHILLRAHLPSRLHNNELHRIILALSNFSFDSI